MIVQLNKIRNALKQRLYARQLQGATYGISVDPVIFIETQNLELAIYVLDLAIEEFNECGFVTPSLQTQVSDACADVGVFSIDFRKGS